MTQEYAFRMWGTYLNAIRKNSRDRILANPSVKFREDVKNGAYDAMESELYSQIKENFSEESANHFLNETQTSAYVLTIRALNHLKFTEDSYRKLLAVLAEISAQS